MAEFIFDSHWYWLSLAVLLLLLEILIPGIFLLWLGLGAAGAGVFLWLLPDSEFVWQLLILVLSMSAAVGAGMRWQKKILRQQPNQLNQGLEGYLQRNALVSQDFIHGKGRVKIDDSSFTATSLQQPELVAGQPVKIIAIKGSTLVVALATHSSASSSGESL